jgi:hypothetical protein
MPTTRIKDPETSKPTARHSVSESLQRMIEEMKEVERDLITHSTYQLARRRRDRIVLILVLVLVSLTIFVGILAATSGLSQLAELLSPQKLKDVMPVAAVFIGILSSVTLFKVAERAVALVLTGRTKTPDDAIRKYEPNLYEQISADLSTLLDTKK